MNQLRCRTEFSFGKTFAPVQGMVDRLKELGAPAAGIVDSGTWGHCAWNKACKKAGIIPIFGVELGVVDSLESEDRPSMWFLALSSSGLQALYRFSSLAQRQMKRGTPMLTYAQVLEMPITLAKFAGDVLDENFLKLCGAFIDFNPSSKMVNKKKMGLVAAGLQPVITSDNAFARAQDNLTFEMIGDGLKMTPQYLLTLDELKQHLPEGLNVDRALTNMTEIGRVAANV